MVVFLRRDIEKLPTRGRPISQSNDLRELYEKRRPLYEAAADVAVDNILLEQTVEEILKLFE